MEEKIIIKRFLVAFIIVILINATISSATAAPDIPPYLYISTEIGGGNNVTLRTAVNALDDIWRADAVADGATSFTIVDFGREIDDGFPDLRPDTPGPYPNPTTNPLVVPDGTYFSFPTSSGLTLTITLLNMDGTGPFGGSSAGMTNTYPRLARSTTLQDGAPRPQSMYTTSSTTRPRLWNEAIGSLSNRNAVLFQFSEPIAAFGAWFGDVETRTDGNGTPARVQLFDETNSLIEDHIIPTSTSNQALCGSPVNDNYTGCGNETTRWIGFIDTNVTVSAMLIIVGDDDSLVNNQGFGESISFIGGTLAEGITAPPELTELPKTGFQPGAVTKRNPENNTIYTQSNDVTFSVPSLGLNTKIVGVPKIKNAWDVEWLGDQVGYLEGTSFPTQPGNTVLTGHVYNHFGLPSSFAEVKNLVYGERLIISAWNQDHIYEVRESYMTTPDDISVLADNGDGYDWLTLITCKGYNKNSDTYEWRYIVKAVLVKIIPK